ncbi:het domain-containing protein [Podospora australis]|uniref:Het domain-containing protein n=1 Tax=Podospora australis TaxID=1536484 RepID=A0AAN7AIL1_9PEZI|nr:het domain-containing protein [Podospora australis]
MRLLQTDALQVVNFVDDLNPRYAILSHTSGHDEVTYQHIQSLPIAQRMLGFSKIKNACKLAKSEGFEYIWIDTCCIDKTSSAELSEAISSMYSWYQRAAICYAYLADVDFQPAKINVAHSRWFTRGWTLQELIAPAEVLFYSTDWQFLGRKTELAEMLSGITGIDTSILTGADHSFVSVARKMFWAAKRQTTRLEDMAYCLMGLFSVNMPLIYGEGSKAFIRLQEEIIKINDDHSIFAWKIPRPPDMSRRLFGLLAESPKAFAETGNLIFPVPRLFSGRQTTRVTNNGLEVQLLVQSQPDTMGKDDFERANMAWYERLKYHKAVLDCQFVQSDGQDGWPTIDIWNLGPGAISSMSYSHFARVNPWILDSTSLRSSLLGMSLHQTPFSEETFSSAHPMSWLSQVLLPIAAFFKETEPWQLLFISISHKPQQPIPLGFHIQPQDRRITIESGLPTTQWFPRDNLMLRRHFSEGGYSISSSRCKTYLETRTKSGMSTGYPTDSTRVVEGAVKLRLEPTPFEKSIYKLMELAPGGDPEPEPKCAALIFGVDITYYHFGGEWTREPWCCLEKIEGDQTLEEFNYKIDWTEQTQSFYRFQYLDKRPGVLIALVSLNQSNVYEVGLLLARESGLPDALPWGK